MIINTETIIHLFNKGMGSKGIAKEMNLTRYVVRKKLLELGLRHHKTTTNTLETILLRVNKNNANGCWEWQGCKNNEGYGMVRFNGKMQGVHRVVYQINFGDIPAGFYVCHKCDNPICCKPEHLFMGTPSDNQIDCQMKNRNPHAKIDYNTAVEIRRLLNNGSNVLEVSKKYNLSKIHISEIYKGNNWPDKALNVSGTITRINSMQNFDPNTQQQEAAGQAEATNDQVAATEQEAQEQALESEETEG